MSATNAFETALLALIFTNTQLDDIAGANDILATGTAGDLTIALHTADPGEAGNQSTSETVYTNYARQTVTRGSEWTVSNNTADNSSLITFPTCGVTGATIGDFSIGNGVTNGMHFYGALDSDLVVSDGVQPEFAIGALNITLT